MEDTVAKLLWSVAQRLPDSPALVSKDRSGAWTTLTYREFASRFECFGAGLLEFGVRRGDHVGLISDNRKEWIISNLGILGIGAADVPRGSDTMSDEAAYILRHADCTVSLVENAEQVKKIVGKKQDLPLLKTLVVLDESFKPDSVPVPAGVAVLGFGQIMDMGKKKLAGDPMAFQREMQKGSPADLATIIYTSGTTGEPKGVMLTHSNFLHNLRTIPDALDIGPADCFLSVLPV